MYEAIHKSLLFLLVMREYGFEAQGRVMDLTRVKDQMSDVKR